MFWDPADHNQFANGIQQAINQVAPHGIFTGDNIFTFGRNLSFLDDKKFMAAFSRHVETDVEKAIIWRINILCWAARQSLRVAGDFVECACYKGISARIICDYIEFGKLIITIIYTFFSSIQLRWVTTACPNTAQIYIHN